MRMRLKNNLEKRMEKASKVLIEIDKSQLNAKEAVKEKQFIHLDEIFPDGEIFLDLGCGKGGFSIEHAKRFPFVNIIGVEMISNVLISGLEEAEKENLPNLRFLNTGVDYLEKYFEKGVISRIFLNFSTPKQKKQYSNTRLTSPRFLEIYSNLLRENGEIHLKTDDRDFFDYSLETISSFGFQLQMVTYDLHASSDEENIVTEYESRFLQEGKPILKVICKKKSRIRE